MVSFGFFNSSNGDRKYSADDVSRIFSYLITDGVLMTYGDKFFTTPATANLGVVLGTGWAWFNHTWTQSDTAIPFELDEPDPSLDRFDTVYLKVDRRSLGRMNSLGVVKGTAAINPVVPTFPTETDVFYHPLAYVKVRHGVTRIAASDIEILVGKTQAPFITSILQTTDITTLFQGWSEQFGTKMNTWQSGYDAKMTEWENEVDTLETSLTANVNAVITSANQQLQTQQTQFTNQMASQQTTFTNSLNGWETDFQTWFDNLQTYLSEDVVTEIWSDLQSLDTRMTAAETKNTQQDTSISNKMDSASYWDPQTINDIPFRGKSSADVEIPTPGATDYPTEDIYKYFYRYPDITLDKKLYPTPKAIGKLIEMTADTTFVSICNSTVPSNKIPANGWYTFILIGGGGGGGSAYSSGNFYVAGGGGGSGYVKIVTLYLTTSCTFNIQCGSGGQTDSMGGNTKITLTLPTGARVSYTATGGYPGKKGSQSTSIYTTGGDGCAGGGGGGIYTVTKPFTATYFDTRGGATVYSQTFLFGGGGGGGRLYINPYDLVSGVTPSSGGFSPLGDGGNGGMVSSNGSRTRVSSNAETGFVNTEPRSLTGNAYSSGDGGGGYFANGGAGVSYSSEPSYGPGGGGGGGIGYDGKGGGGGGKNSSYGAQGKGFGGGGGGRSSGSYAGGGGGGGGCALFLNSLGFAIPGGATNSVGVPGAVIILAPGIRKAY